MNTTAQQERPAAGAQSHPAPLTIVVADRGHVWVGHVKNLDSDGFVILGEGCVIRRWGTTEGLNQLAAEGPQRDTKLDAPATVHIARRAIIALIPCEMTAWTA